MNFQNSTSVLVVLAPSHKWKIEVGKISVELDCKGDKLGDVVESGVEGFLMLSVSLDDGDEGRLLKKETVTKNAYVEVKRKEGSGKLWPTLPERDRKFMTITKEGTRKSLKVEIGRFEEGRGRMESSGIVSGNTTEWELTCKGDDFLKTGDRKVIYGGVFGSESGLDGGLMETIPLDMGVSLGECDYRKGEGQATCDLKVVTGTDLK